MSTSEIANWLHSEQGHYVTDWEQSSLNIQAGNVFGFNALQIGLPEIDFLLESRIPLRIHVDKNDGVSVYCDASYLPFATACIDLVVLAHSLEFNPDPHQLLREVERILIPEGRIIILGFNPFSLWGLRRRLPLCPAQFPWSGHYISVPRLKDWLSLLSFDLEEIHFGRYAPPCQSYAGFCSFAWMEIAGKRWWPITGGVYIIQAVKRVHGMRLIKPNWRSLFQLSKSLAPIARKENPFANDY